MKNKWFLLGFLPILLTSCSENVKSIESKIFGFGTYAEIKLYEGDKTNVEEIENIFYQYDKLSDNYLERDIENVYSINQTNDEVTISSELYQMLEKSFNVVNEGATYFNPLCGSLAKKWKEALDAKEVLSDSVIAEELEKMNNSSLTFLNNNHVKRDGLAEIDLGAIAKGYTLDIVKNYLEENNIHQYLINAGSSSLLLGEKKSKDGLFSVGLKDIKNAYLKLKNCFVSTSSISEQNAKIDGVTYSHIVNPFTGSSVCENDGVIVVSETGYFGDALSTSMMMNTVEEIQTLENDLNVKVIVIKNKQITYRNKDLKVYYH